MKKIALLLLVLSVVVFGMAYAETAGVVVSVAKPDQKVFEVYVNGLSPENHYILSGWMGDYGDIKLNDRFILDPHSGSSCIEFVYSAKKSQGQGWAGVYWQNPTDNWGSKKGGFDLVGMTKLTFWARGAKGGEKIQKFLVGGIKGVYSDSTMVEIGPIELTNQWNKYVINLAGKDLTYISGGFGWTATADLNPQGAIFYIDDIRFQVDPTMKPAIRIQEEMPFYVYQDKTSMKNHFIPSGWMGDPGDVKLDNGSTEMPYLGDTCIKIIYSGKATQGARWAGIYWQQPANNWGTVDAGFNLSKATKLTFWARGANGGERIEEFKIGEIKGVYGDSDDAGIYSIILNKKWTKYTIDLKGKDLSYIVGGFCWATSADVNADGVMFYLDEIKYE
jgi:hypothetical protein